LIVSTAEKALVAWGLVFTVPKLLLLPTLRVLLRAMADTARQDEIDADWLSAQEPRGDGGGGQVWRWRRRPPHPTRPRPGARCSARTEITPQKPSRHREVARAVGRR
jgi:hypothetical protein